MNYLLVAAILLSSGFRVNAEQAQENDLSSLKKQFIQQISTDSDIEEGPFSFNYEFRTVFFSNAVISLFGELTVHDRLPHGWKQYEGKTLYKATDQWKEVSLEDIFPTPENKEFLRSMCEKILKKDPLSYFSGNTPLCETLKYEDIYTFVVDDQHLIIVFQPYVVGSGADGPFVVKIPIDTLKRVWADSHMFCLQLSKSIESRSFLSSWDLDKFYNDVAEVN